MPPRKRKADALTVPSPSPTYKIRYVSEDHISDLLFCSICQDVFDEPVRISCGHTFCQACLNGWLKAQNGQGACPACRQVISKQGSHRDLLAIAFLSREQVFCPFPGCAWMGARESMNGHASECDCDPSKLPVYLNIDSDERPRSSESLTMRLYRTEEGRKLLKERHEFNENIAVYSLDSEDEAPQ